MGSQTILANVRILAIGQNVQEENGKKVVTGGNATLELDPTQAELIVLAQHTGGSNLHLVLRSLVDSGGSTETVGDLENLETPTASFAMRDLLQDYTRECPDRMRSLHQFMATSSTLPD